MTGNERRNPKSAAIERVSPRSIPKDTVTPNLLMPANKAGLCPIPIMKAWPGDTRSAIARFSSAGNVCKERLEVSCSAPSRMMPFTVRKIAALSGFSKFF